jgi:Aromatic-ring-opening dioxygenase LigAB, LigA subunit
MAPFDVNSVCWRVVHDAAFHDALASEPERALRETGVNDDERAALLAGDVKTLYELGASPFLMEHLANHRVLGLDPERYSERIRQATWVAP